MVRKHVFFAAMCVCALVWSGCAMPPAWVKAEEDIFFSPQDPAFYGVGKGEPKFSEARQAVARIEARRNLAEVKARYAERRLTNFAADNEEWFRMEAFKDEAGNISRRVVNRSLFPVDFVGRWEDTRYLPWEDKRGRQEGKGTVHVLSKKLLDAEFIDELLNTTRESLETDTERLLKTDAGTVIAALADSLGR